jgi:hypothetical protein
MAIVVSSIAELQRVMMEETQRAMIKTEDTMLEDISERINKEVYQAYTPKVYERTGDLKRSLNSGTYEVNPQRIRSYVNHDPNYANWYSVKDGTRFEGVPDVVSFGYYGTFEGVGYDGQMHRINPNGTAWGKPRYYMYLTEREYMDALSWHLPYSCRVNY